jgi:YD repeat-containing protein
VAAVCALLSWPVLAQTTIQYIYDDLGRLIAVSDPSGDTAIYHYDAVGNILSIDRHASSQVSIVAFSPSAGPVGTTVTIYGTGFSSNAAQDSVSFHGTAASVSSATATKLVVTVPSGATTGTIGVTAPGGSATSTSSYVVAASGAPTISSFTPTAGVAGTSVTITGTNFETVATNDRTNFNTTLAPVTAATSTSLSATVPLLTGSGPLTVATPKGSFTTSSDFIVPPSPYTPSDVDSSGRLPYATATTVTVSTANKIALKLFDGVAGHRVSLLGTNGMTGQVFGCDVNVALFNPNGTALGAPACMEGSGFIDTSTLATSGTYTIEVDPASTATGSVTLTVYDVPADVSGTITPGGSSVTMTTTTPGQNGALTFSGTAGHRISLLGTNGMLGQVFGCDVNVSILNPNGTVLVSATCMEDTGFVDTTTLPTTGTYTIQIDPVAHAVGNLTLTLYDVAADLTGTITPGGSAVTASIATPGQNAAYTFSGTSGHRISLVGSNGMSGQVAFACDVNVSILKPDATVLAGPTCMEDSGFIDATTLPISGTYTVKVEPTSWATGSLTLNLYDVPADVSGSITAGGSAVTVTTTTPGQNGALTFSGTAGHRLSLVGSNGMTGQVWFACDVNVTVLKPDSNTLVSPTCMEGSGFIDATSVPTTGTYTIQIDPAGIAVGSLTLALYDVPGDATGTVTIGGSAAGLTMSTPGQNGGLTFSGTASQQVTVHVTNNPWTSFFAGPTVRLLSTDGTTVLASVSSSASSFDLSTVTLPSTGTYTITVDPSGAQTGSLNVSVTSP